MMPVYMNASLTAASCGLILTECISSFSNVMKLSDVCLILICLQRYFMFSSATQISRQKTLKFEHLDLGVFCIGVFKHYNNMLFMFLMFFITLLPLDSYALNF